MKQAFEDQCKSIGLDLNKWTEVSARPTKEYSDEWETWEFIYECNELTLYCVIENFQGKEKVIVEFQMDGD